MLTLRELTLTAIVVRIVVAIVLGGIIGLERGMKNRAAGLRTYMLVSLGACVVMLINQYTTQVFGTGDPVRLGAQVISGIGFLGAGTIIVTSHNQIKGLTTAAGLWTSACIGLAIGIGLYEVAIVAGLWASACIGLAIGIGLYEVALIAGLCVFLVLTVLHEMDYFLHSRTRMVDTYIELDQTVSLGRFIRNLRDQGLEISNIQREHDTAYGDEVLSFTATIKGQKKTHQAELVRFLRKQEGVKYLEVL